MNKLVITIFLIFTAQSRTRWRMDRFTGCTSTLFTNPSNFRIMKIDYSTACTALEVCAASYDMDTDKQSCLKAFDADQRAFCAQYTAVNLWRRRYCYRIVDRNMILAGELADSLFKSSKKLFKTRISDTTATAGVCLENDGNGVTCDFDATEQLWDVYQLSNDRLIFKDQDGKCLSSSGLSMVDCDFDSDSQWWILGEALNPTVAANTDGVFTLNNNEDTKRLKINATTEAAELEDNTATSAGTNELVFGIVETY